MKISVGLLVDAYAVVHLDVPEGTSQEDIVKEALRSLCKENIEDIPVTPNSEASLNMGDGNYADVPIEDAWIDEIWI